MKLDGGLPEVFESLWNFKLHNKNYGQKAQFYG
jgi:hypothetical protein